MNVIELQRALRQLRLAAWPWCWKRGCVRRRRSDGADRSDLLSGGRELTRRLLFNLSRL